jgi:hypothetical protein
MMGQELHLDAPEQVQRILSDQFKPGPPNETATLAAVLSVLVLDRRYVVAAINRLGAGCEQ